MVEKEVELFPAYEPNDSAVKWLYLDRKGEVAIPAQFESADIFRDGLALVSEKGRFGFIGKDGKYVIPAKYKWATVFAGGLAFVVEPDSCIHAIDRSGKTVFRLPQAAEVQVFTDGVAAFCTRDDKWGFVDKSGKVVLTPKYDRLAMANHGLAEARLDGRKGVIDMATGKEVIPFGEYDDLSLCVENEAILVRKGNYCGLVDRHDKFVINPRYKRLMEDEEGLFVFVTDDDKAGWCDGEGKEIIPSRYAELMGFIGKDMAPVRLESDGKWGIIDREGNTVMPAYYDAVHEMAYSPLLLVEKDDKWGAFDPKTGKDAFDPQFEDIDGFYGDLAIVKVSDQYGLIDKTGRFVANPKYGGIRVSAYPRMTSVESDWFDLEKVVSAVSAKIDAIESLATMKVGDILAKYEIHDSDIPRLYSPEINIDLKKDGEVIASMMTAYPSMTALADRVEEGWTYKYVVDKDAFPWMLRLYFSLGKKHDRIEAIVKEIARRYKLAPQADSGECSNFEAVRNDRLMTLSWCLDDSFSILIGRNMPVADTLAQGIDSVAVSVQIPPVE